MNDIDLLVFGCAVMFIAVAGAYVFARERFVYTDSSKPEEEGQTAPAAMPEPQVAQKG